MGGKPHKSPLSFAECSKGKKKEKIKLHLNGNPAGVKQQLCDFSLEATRGDGAFCSSEDLKRAGDAAEEFTAEPDR